MFFLNLQFFFIIYKKNFYLMIKIIFFITLINYYKIIKLNQINIFITSNFNKEINIYNK